MFRSGHPGDRHRHVGAEDPARPDGHGPDRGLPDHWTVGNAQQALLDVAVVGHYRAPEGPTGPGDIGQAGADQTAGQRLGDGQGQALPDQFVQYNRLHGLLVTAEHIPAD